MAEKYSYADVIIDPEDPRVEIGKEYYASKNIPDALFKANECDEMFCYKLLSVHDGAYGPFWMDKDSPDSFDFLIRKKEPEKKDPIEVFKDIQSRRNINAESNPHASEVYVGPEYKMLCGDEAGDGGYIGDLVNGYLAKGWKLYGAPFYGNGFIWQAMVRGV